MINLGNYIISQKLVWVKRLFTNSGMPWAQLLSSSINTKRLYSFGSIWPKILAKKTSNCFWKEVFLAWHKFESEMSVNDSEKLTGPLWYNSDISTEPI